MPRYIFIDNTDGKAYGDLADLHPKLMKMSQADLPIEVACEALDHLIEREGRGYRQVESLAGPQMPKLRSLPGYLVYLCEDRELVPLLYDSSDPQYISSVRRNGVFLGYVQIVRSDDPIRYDTYQKLPVSERPSVLQ